MRMGITIRMGAAHDDVTFKGSGKGSQAVTIDRAEIRKNPDRNARGDALRALTHHVVEETDVVKDRDRRRFRRINAERARARNAARRSVDNTGISPE